MLSIFLFSHVFFLIVYFELASTENSLINKFSLESFTSNKYDEQKTSGAIECKR